MKETTLGQVADYINGRAFKPSEWEDSGLPIIRIQNLNNPDAQYNYTSRTYEDKYLVQNGDLLFAWSASLGAHIWCGYKAWLNQHIFKVVPKSDVSKMYLYYYLHYIIDEIYAKTHGTGMVHITMKPFKETKIFVPSMMEQQRIVALIQSLFEKLDRAKEIVQNTLDSFENRKSAIIHMAFTGELTAKWREENGVDFERDWEEKKFGDLGELERGRSKHRPRNAPELFGGEYPFIQTGDIANANVYITEHKQTLSEFGLKQSRLFPKGTLCITIAANIGDVAILSYDCCFPDSVVGFTPNAQTLSKFIYYYMSIMQAEIEHYAPATAQKNINLKILNDITIKTPPLEEQQEIVRILDSLLEKEQRAKELTDLIENIDHMKKSILARAFRGGLRTNNPEEESALELLREVLQEN